MPLYNKDGKYFAKEHIDLPDVSWEEYWNYETSSELKNPIKKLDKLTQAYVDKFHMKTGIQM